MRGKKGKKRWIAISISAIVIVGLIIAGAAAVSSKNDTTEIEGTVEKITKRTIANSISGNGVIEAANSQDVTGGSYGVKVATVNVEVGDTIEAGDVICVFDTDGIDEQIADLRKRIKDMEADRATQNAEFDQRMVDANTNRQEQLTTAANNLAATQTELAEAEAELAVRQQRYDEEVAAYEALGEKMPISDETNLRSQISSQEMIVDSARSRIDGYQYQIDSLNGQNNSAIEDSKRSYNEQVDAVINTLEEQIDRYKEQKADLSIEAGISGTVTAVNVKEGETFSVGTIATIEGVDHFIVEAQIEEYDIPDVAVGMKVLIKTDATRDAELEGVVSYIAPRATNSGSSTNTLSSLMGGLDTSSFTSSSSGSATYLVKIELNEQNDRLRLGMNAKTSIITQESVDVWSVPYDAIYTREDGTTYLEQVTGKDEEGNLITKELEVQVGIQGTYYVEVISDLINEDTEILIPDAQGNNSIEELLNMMGADAGI